MKEVVERLIKEGKTISTMESCTGGEVANAITNIPGASDIFKFSAVTYSNEFKIKMGVDSNVIDKYSVYSEQTADEMSKKISLFTNSNYAVGVTGKMGVIDKANPYGENNTIYISIYDRDNDKFYNEVVSAILPTREENKKEVVNKIVEMLLRII